MSEAKQSLIPIMNGQYERLYAIESQWDIRLHEGDQRPRIDYFHDAIRALTSGEGDPYAKNSRLSVEHLAYDMSQLRLAQSYPAGQLNRTNRGSPHAEVMVAGEQSAAPRGPDRATRADITQLYKDYTVLFAALFAEIADMNFQARSEEVDSAVEDVTKVEEVLKQLANQVINQQQAMQLLDQIEVDALRERVQLAIQSRTIRRAEADQIIDQLKGMEAQMEKEKLVINKAHLNYVTSQLAVYEESKETIKRLAAQGMNLAGKFVEQAVTQAAGRGAGMGMS